MKKTTSTPWLNHRNRRNRCSIAVLQPGNKKEKTSILKLAEQNELSRKSQYLCTRLPLQLFGEGRGEVFSIQTSAEPAL
jgi:hypothetical protein